MTRVHIYPTRGAANLAIATIDVANTEVLGPTETATTHYGPRGKARLVAAGHATIDALGGVTLTPAGIAAGLSMNGRNPVTVAPVPRRTWATPIPLRDAGGFAVLEPPAAVAGRTVDVAGTPRQVPAAGTAVVITPDDVERP